MQAGLMRAHATIDMYESPAGGLVEPLPSPSQSLILRIHGNNLDDESVDLGVRITTLSGEPISPGTSGLAVALDFWSDLADVYVVPSTAFTLRYPSRVVGDGRVLDVVPFPTP